jgi:serine/threonine protein kinase/tetratricopeptide (TPR) repeat protein
MDLKKLETAELPASIGPYKVLKSLGRGGMGEVFLAEDLLCGRKVALKRVKPEWKDNSTLRRRFLREAKVASSLTHPSIVPILAIQMDPPEIYYTMPYIEGETLRQILKISREQEKRGEPLTHPIGSSIPALSRIFLQVCEAIAYTHSKGVLHRDLKPENIIVGNFGEVMILDWGIADFIDSLESDESLPEIRASEKAEDLTRPGKITGTLAYMAPERLKGQSSSIQTDLYALGVILYQLLTLQLPFQRKTIASFRKLETSEQVLDPMEMAPYREIPRPLASICVRCLQRDPAKRFQSVKELIQEVKKTIEGRPEWMWAANVNLDRKNDWQLQENVLLSKHLAITQNFDVTQWAALSISKASFADNVRMDAHVRIHKAGEGVGFLLNVPTPGKGNTLEEGYCLWIGLDHCRLFRNNIQVMQAPKFTLSPQEWHQIRIEKLDDHLRFYLNQELKITFASHLPMPGTHIGILAKDDRFEIRQCKIYDGSSHVMVGCLAVPNAFLSHRLYDVALQEYRRIGHCFPGRVEGREALFRAGLTLLEKGKAEKNIASREKLFHSALKEFETLYKTPGAPLEYLGKSLVYASLEDAEEEAKCLELGLRKFPSHPLLPILKEHILYRMHESSLNHREAAYRILLLAIRHIPDLLEYPDTLHLIESLKENWEPLTFIEEDPKSDPLLNTSIQLAFWLAKIPILMEIARTKKGIGEIALGNALHCLLELESPGDAKAILKELPSNALSLKRRKCLELSIHAADHPLDKLAKSALSLVEERMEPYEMRLFLYLLRQCLKQKEISLALEILSELKTKNLSVKEKAYLESIRLWSLLLDRKWEEAKKLLQTIPQNVLTQEQSPLHFPYGCWIYAVEGPKNALAHFGSALDTPYPPTAALPSHFLTGRIDDEKGWIEEAFWWEKKELHRQIDLFYKIIGKHGKTKTPHY